MFSLFWFFKLINLAFRRRIRLEPEPEPGKLIKSTEFRNLANSISNLLVSLSLSLSPNTLEPEEEGKSELFGLLINIFIVSQLLIIWFAFREPIAEEAEEEGNLI